MNKRTRKSLLSLLILLIVGAITTYFFWPDQATLLTPRVITSKTFGEHLIVAAGDIAEKGGDQAKTAALVRSLHPEKVLTLGDTVYESGTAAEFKEFYEPTWGAFKNITAPTVGNHEYKTPGAAGYYDYFGNLAGPDRRGYYSYDLGAWHLISLNSEVINKKQLDWLVQDLGATDKKCILAYWHEPLFSSGNEHGNNPLMRVFWERLYAQGTDIILNGHDHDYERFAKQNPQGRADPRGIREFVAGTGGGDQRGFVPAEATTEVRTTGVPGVLQLTLRDGSYDAEFKSVEGSTFTDKISEQKCNGQKEK
ncbi:MAG: metallophosphoesterase [Patescibacteria group bacterium]